MGEERWSGESQAHICCSVKNKKILSIKKHFPKPLIRMKDSGKIVVYRSSKKFSLSNLER